MTINNKINHFPWHPVRRWAKWELTTINKIIIHQELGEANVEAVNRYHLKPNHISSRGCPHFCYHYDIEKTGEVIQANELNQITWHTTGQNNTGIGIMLAGNFAGQGHEMGITEPTPEQIHSLEELCDYLINAFGLSNRDVYGHYHFGKPAGPGYVVQEWIENRRKK